MAESNAILPFVNEETARLKWFQAFMRGRYPVLLLPPLRNSNSVIRLELEQRMYANGTIAHEPGIDCPKGFQAFRRCLKGPLLYLTIRCCGIVRL